MANNGKDAEKDAPKSLGERVLDHARGPMGLASIARELKYALTDIRHKVIEEATYGRAVTPHWRDPANAPQPGGGIHGSAATPAQEAASVHGTMDAPKPDTGGDIHGKAESEPKDKGPAAPAEPKGLGMSYAELTAGWEKAAAPGQDAARERQQPKEQEHAVER